MPKNILFESNRDAYHCIKCRRWRSRWRNGRHIDRQRRWYNFGWNKIYRKIDRWYDLWQTNHRTSQSAVDTVNEKPDINCWGNKSQNTHSSTQWRECIMIFNPHKLSRNLFTVEMEFRYHVFVQPIIQIDNSNSNEFATALSIRSQSASVMLFCYFTCCCCFRAIFNWTNQFNFRKEQSMANLNARFYDECNFITITLIPPQSASHDEYVIRLETVLRLNAI